MRQPPPSRSIAFAALAGCAAVLVAVAAHAQYATPVGPYFQVNLHAAGEQSYPSVAPLDAGFVVAWQGSSPVGSDTDGYSIVARGFDRDGRPVGVDFQINEQTAFDQVTPAVAGDGADGFVVVWNVVPSAPGPVCGAARAGTPTPGTRGSPQGFSVLRGRRFGADGVGRGDEFSINTFTLGNHYALDVEANGEGFVAVWASEWDYLAFRPYAAAGTPLAEPVLFVADGPTPTYPVSLGLAPSGAITVAWSHLFDCMLGCVGGGAGARSFTRDGAGLGAAFAIGPTEPGPVGGVPVISARVARASHDTLTTVWAEFYAGVSRGIRLQQRSPTGGNAGPVFVVTEGSGYFLPTHVLPGDAGFVVAWEQGDTGSSPAGYRARHFAPAGTSPQSPAGAAVVEERSAAITGFDLAVNGSDDLLATWSQCGAPHDPDGGAIQGRVVRIARFASGFEVGDLLEWPGATSP